MVHLLKIGDAFLTTSSASDSRFKAARRQWDHLSRSLTELFKPPCRRLWNRQTAPVGGI